MTNALIAIDAILTLLLRGAEVAQLVSKAQAEGRDITDDELMSVVAQNDAARARLVSAIEEKKRG